jgi:PHD/YefM family antitoxin component YafN of YafNO toxin-antitoxin module
MPAKPKSVKEARTTYRAKRKRTGKPSASKFAIRWAEIEKSTQPIILKRNGEPVAVVVKFADFQRLGASQIERRAAIWRELDALLARVHSRTKDYSAEEIEADITAARQEVRDLHNARRGS